jgi:hypothetical protein
MIDGFARTAGQPMRPAFEAVWNAAGYEKALSYDDVGNWIGL